MARAIIVLVVIIVVIVLLVNGLTGKDEDPAKPVAPSIPSESQDSAGNDENPGQDAQPDDSQKPDGDGTSPDAPQAPSSGDAPAAGNEPGTDSPGDNPVTEAPGPPTPAEDPKPEIPQGTADNPVALTNEQADAQGIMLLVNKQNTVSSDYEPPDLAPIKYYAEDRPASCRYLRQEAADHFHEMIEAAQVEGYHIVMTTAYRSYSYQKTLWNNYVARDGEAAASRYSARPGTSEHQTGLAADVSAASVNYALTQKFGETEEGKWLAENAHKYGFILRFTKEGEEITGYMYEPWHFRYVGEAAAKEIFEQGCTLEEYLAQ